MRVVHYQVVSAATGTVTSQGAQNIVQSGRIVGIQFRFRATGGAGAGFYSAELGVNATANSSAELGAINRLLTPGAATFHVTNGGVNSQCCFIPCNWPVRAGDNIALNQTQTGTAAASMMIAIDVFVEEAS